MYNWPNVAQRTEAVYRAALAAQPDQDALLPRLRRYRSIGSWAGLLFCCVVVLLHWFWRLLEWQQPGEGVEPAADWPSLDAMLGCASKQQQQQLSHQSWQGERTAGQQQQQQEEAGMAEIVEGAQQQLRKQQQQLQLAEGATAAAGEAQQLRKRQQQRQQEEVQFLANPAAGGSKQQGEISGGSRRYNLRSTAKQAQA
jgi:hypothetical protein